MKDFLPIGSIVTLKNGKVKLMIIGYCKALKDDKIKDKDYIACIYPLGIVDLKSLLAFNHEQIDKVYVLGLNSVEFNNFKSILLNNK